MKKFSKISNSPVGESPLKKSDPINESDFFKIKVLNLMNEILRIQMYGPITRYHVAGTMKITGQELFLEALVDMVQEFSTKSNLKSLEKLKLNENLIDIEIQELESVLEKISNSRISKSRNKIKSLYNRYKDDKAMLMKIVDRNISQIKKGETAYWRAVAADNLSTEKEFSRNSTLKEIANKYYFRASQLGYKK